MHAHHRFFLPGALRPGLRLRARGQGESRKFPSGNAGWRGFLSALLGTGASWVSSPPTPLTRSLAGARRPPGPRRGVSKKPLALPSGGEQGGGRERPVLGSGVPWEPPSPLPAAGSESRGRHGPQGERRPQGHRTLLAAGDPFPPVHQDPTAGRRRTPLRSGRWGEQQGGQRLRIKITSQPQQVWLRGESAGL